MVLSLPLAIAAAILSGHTGSAAPSPAAPTSPWSAPVRIDPAYRHHFVRPDGSRLFLFNKTAWHYFSQARPEITLDRANALGVNVIRVGLECRYYHEEIGLDAWPWEGTRSAPDFSRFNEAYWNTVDARIAQAASRGIGLNLTLFTSLHLPDNAESVRQVQPYLERVVTRLARHPNIFCWEVHNEHVSNPAFQEAVARFLRDRDPLRRPVISSNGTTDYPLWPNADWMDMAVVHHCTGNQPQYDLRDWYLAIARNLRVYGKPAFNNETGRERRHRNDDPVHRRKQLWIAAAAGGYTTWHSWDGCEGIDNDRYQAPGQEFVAPFVRWWSSQPFWRIDPDFTALQLPDDEPAREDLVPVVLASASREFLIAYLFSRRPGSRFRDTRAVLRLPDGDYRVEFFSPSTGEVSGSAVTHVSRGLRTRDRLVLPEFVDDLALRLTRTVTRDPTAIPGTQ